MSESAPRLLIDARAARHQGREATLQLQRSRLADRRSGAVTGGRPNRTRPPPEPAHAHIDALQLGKTSGSLRCSEPATVSAARFVRA
jgi:hypothetical protein